MTCAPAGRLTFGPSFDDAVALDQDFAGSDDLAVLDVEHARGVQNNGRLRLREDEDGQEERDDQSEDKSACRHNAGMLAEDE